MDELTTLALHEAGHAVAHIRLNVLQDRVTIVRSGDALGSATAEGDEHVWNATAAEDMVLCYCAGYAALRAAGYDEPVADAGADDDFARATKLIELWGLAGTLDDWKAKSFTLMRRPENINAVRVVAEHLIDRRTIDSDLVDALVNLADGEMTQAEFEQYLELRRAVGAD